MINYPYKLWYRESRTIEKKIRRERNYNEYIGIDMLMKSCEQEFELFYKKHYSVEHRDNALYKYKLWRYKTGYRGCD